MIAASLLVIFAVAADGLVVGVDRRQVLLASSSLLAMSQPAKAAEDAFELMRKEVDGTGSGGLDRLEKLLLAEDYSEVIKFSKEYFVYVGKGLMTSARKDMEDDDRKKRAKDIYNKVQEDLIAINKLSRPKGQENQPEALRFFAMLKDDMRAFVDI